jgi:hypothetical protein
VLGPLIGLLLVRVRLATAVAIIGAGLFTLAVLALLAFDRAHHRAAATPR